MYKLERREINLRSQAGRGSREPIKWRVSFFLSSEENDTSNQEQLPVLFFTLPIKDDWGTSVRDNVE